MRWHAYFSAAARRACPPPPDARRGVLLVTTYRVAIIGTGRMAGFIDDELPDGDPLMPHSHLGAYRAVGRTEVVAVANRGRTWSPRHLGGEGVVCVAGRGRPCRRRGARQRRRVQLGNIAPKSRRIPGASRSGLGGEHR